MTRLRATFHYEVRQLVVSREHLGTSRDLSIDGVPVTIIFPVAVRPRWGLGRVPAENPDFDEQFPPRPVAPVVAGHDARWFANTEQRFTVPADDDVAIDVLRVDVFTTKELSASDFAPDNPPEHYGPPSHEVMRRAERIADTAIARLVAWARIEGEQPWLALGTEPPLRVGYPQLVDLDAMQRLPIPGHLHSHSVYTTASVDAAQLDSLIEHIESGDDPDFADELLADAQFLETDLTPPRDLPARTDSCGGRM